MSAPLRTPDATPMAPRYLFIVARNRPDILARVQERLGGDARLEVIVDRRHGERRALALATAHDRRRADRRRRTKFWDDLTVHPTLVAPKRVESPAVASHESRALRADNGRLREEVADLQGRLETLSAANEELCTDNRDLRAQIAALQRRIDGLASADADLRAAAARLCAEIASLQSSFAALAQRLTSNSKAAGAPPG